MILDSQTILAFAIVCIGSYLLGSLNFALIISRTKRDDIRKYGSGNAGMTNVLRTYGKRDAVLTTIGDFGKLIVAVLFSRWLFAQWGIPFDAGYPAGLMVLLGHIYPLFFGFRGGKGAMTGIGVMFVLNPLVFAIVLGVFIPLTFVTKIVSLSSVLGAIAFPIVTCMVNHFQGKPLLADAIFSVIIGGIVILKHKENIKRLLNGTENKFGSQKK